MVLYDRPGPVFDDFQRAYMFLFYKVFDGNGLPTRVSFDFGRSDNRGYYDANNNAIIVLKRPATTFVGRDELTDLGTAMLSLRSALNPSDWDSVGRSIGLICDPANPELHNKGKFEKAIREYLGQPPLPDEPKKQPDPPPKPAISSAELIVGLVMLVIAGAVFVGLTGSGGRHFDDDCPSSRHGRC